MAVYEINGGKKLYGEYAVQRSKNSTLAIMCASVLTRGETFIDSCPDISDVNTLGAILTSLGARVVRDSRGLFIDTRNIYSTNLPEGLCSRLRASLFLVGPLLGRFGNVTFHGTGGCSIGSRPIDIHIDGLKALGAAVGEGDDKLIFSAAATKGEKITLKFPSVGATENVMMCAALSDGTTVIENCAAEPEIKDLQDYLNLCGAKIFGAGGGTITVEGVKKLHGGVEYCPIPDRIESGSVLLAVMATGGEVLINNVARENISKLTEKIINNTCKITVYNDKIYIHAKERPNGFGTLVTSPYPGFATDLHPQLIACGAVADGETIVKETVFDCRFKYVDELKRFGADVCVDGQTVRTVGRELHGAAADATDLRGGMALVIAALAAKGASRIGEIRHIERGYENLHKKLSLLGADIVRREDET